MNEMHKITPPAGPSELKRLRIPSASQNTRYVILIISLLFVLTAGYSGYVIYQNKHNHTGSSFNLFGALTHKESSIEKLKKTQQAQQVVKQQAQYNFKAPPLKPQATAEISQRQAIGSFFDDYLANKKAGKSQSVAVARYGTASLAAQSATSTPDFDALLCGSAVVPTEVSINESEKNDDGTTSYALILTDARDKTRYISAQAQVKGQGSESRIERITCLGSI